MKIDHSFFLPENQAPKKMPLSTYLAGIPADQRKEELQMLVDQHRIVEEIGLGYTFYYVIEERA